MLVATSDGNGFLVGEDEMLSSTRKGRRGPQRRRRRRPRRLIVPAAGDHVAVIGENRKLLVFPLAQLNEMSRGKGVRLQRYKDGGIADAQSVRACRRPDVARFGRTHFHRRPRRDLKDWIGNRAEAGRLPPKGFPKSNKFEG